MQAGEALAELRIEQLVARLVTTAELGGFARIPHRAVANAAVAAVARLDLGLEHRLRALAQHHVSVDMIIQAFHEGGSVNDITFTVKRSDLGIARSVLEETAARIGAEGVLADEDVAKVSIVGASLMDQPDVAARMFGALGSAGINIKMISTSEIRISCAVSNKDAERAVRVVHDLFQLDVND